MKSNTESSTTPGACMTPEIARLIVELTQQLDAAYGEIDEAKADAADVREQRAIVLQQLHEANKTIKRQAERIATLCDENRALRQQAAEWMKVAA